MKILFSSENKLVDPAGREYRGLRALGSLSVVIVNYNTDALLTECLQSIKVTTKDFKIPQVEVIVVDNASKDGSIKGIRSSTGRIEVILNKKNLGFARAVNQGIKIADGEYILLLNPDTRVTDGALSSLLKFAKEYDDAGVVGARLLDPDGKIQASVFNFPTVWNAILEFWFGKRGKFLKYAPQTNKPIAVDAVVGAAFLITPEAKEKAGLLDERYFMYFEDLDYCRRVKNIGLKVYYLPSSRITHYHGVSGRELVPEKDQWKRLIPSSKTYYGILRYYLITFIIWFGQRTLRRFF